MTDALYKKLKARHGEGFARTIRSHHNGLLEIPDLDKIVRHAGRDARPLLPYLMTLMQTGAAPEPTEPGDPFALLDQAGYTAFYADTLEAQNSIKHYFAPDELLCTFNDVARHHHYHIVHAIRKDVDQIHRADFMGREQREDAYGTSVISIQILKNGGFISIKNRYNHAVAHCDNTFNSNPDNIIGGLSAALKHRFNVDFSSAGNTLPDGFILMKGQIVKYHTEDNNIYYGDQVYVLGGEVQEVNIAAGDALFDYCLFDNKNKMLVNIDPENDDSFAEDFNRTYGGNRQLHVRQGNLMLGEHVLIGAKHSRIVTLDLPGLTTMTQKCLTNATALVSLNAPSLITMGDECLEHTDSLTSLDIPKLLTIGNHCLMKATAMTIFSAPSLTTMGSWCLTNAINLTSFAAPVLTTMGNECLENANALTAFTAPVLTTMGNGCLKDTPVRKSVQEQLAQSRRPQPSARVL